MSANILGVSLKWKEGKRIEATVRGNQLVVDRIYEDGPMGMGFRPTELYLSAVGACTMGTILEFCENMDIPIESFSVEVEGKREHKPERVSEVRLIVNLEGDIPEERIETLKRVAKGCRIHYTMTHPPKFELDLTVASKKG